MKTMAERLTWARMQAQFRSARAAAIDNGWNETTYRSHETGGRSFDIEQARRYGRAYGIDPIWLLHGVGAPSKQQTIRIVGMAGAGPDGSIVFGEGKGNLGEAPWIHEAGAETVAVKVSGNWLRGIAEDGWLVYYDDVHDPPSDDLIGHVCAVGLEDGRVLIKTLIRGRKKRHFDLESPAAPTIHDARLVWATPVLDVKTIFGQRK